MDEEGGERIGQTLEAVFQRVLTQNMAGLPLLNPNLQVRALAFSNYRQHWAGILITPWFMNLMLLPSAAVDWPPLTAGEKFPFRFPAGEFEFIVAHEPEIGSYASCSLYSPMFQFDRQAVAVAVAEAAWRALFRDVATNVAAPKTISRRDLLRGKFGSGR